MFDNGTERSVQSSRALEIQVDPIEQTEEEVWEWMDPEKDMFSSWGGDAFRLPNGNTLVTEPENSIVVEVTPAGDKVWQLPLRHKLHPDSENLTSIYKAVRTGAKKGNEMEAPTSSLTPASRSCLQ